MKILNYSINKVLGILVLMTFNLLFVGLSTAQQKGAFLEWVIQTKGEGNLLAHGVLDVSTSLNNEIIVVGGFNRTVDFDPLFDGFSIETPYQDTTISFLAKYSTKGKLIWINVMDADLMENLKTDEEGNIYVTGKFKRSVDFDPGSDSVILHPDSEDYFVASYTSNGSFRWVKKFHNVGSARYNIQDLSICNETQTLSFIGSFNRAVDFHPDEETEVIFDTGSMTKTFFYLANFSFSGEYNWVKAFDNSRTNGQYQRNYRLTNNEDGDIYISGTYFDTLQLDPDNETAIVLTQNNERENFIAKYSNDGEFLWYSVTQGAGAGITNVAYNNGSVFVTGACFHDFSFYSSIQHNTTLIETDETVQRSMMVIELDAISSEVKQSILLKTYGDIIGGTRDLAFDLHNNIYVSGAFQYTGHIDFNPSTTETFNVIQSSSNAETFLAKYTKEGAFQWAFGMPGGRYTLPKGLIAINNDVIILGEYRGSPDVSAYGTTPVIISTDFSSSINPHSFIAKYSQGFLNTQESDISNSEVVVFPNPSQHTNTLIFNKTQTEQTTIDLYDIQGRLIQPVYNGTISEGMEITVDITGLSSGLYVYRVSNATIDKTIRFVKE